MSSLATPGSAACACLSRSDSCSGSGVRGSPGMTKAQLAVMAVLLSGCVTAPAASGDGQFASCPAYAPAYKVTDDFMRTFNSKDAAAWGSVFHFPSVRIASGTVRIIEKSADLEQSFDRLEATGWDHSAWAKRQV